ncbi:YktB family protein [Cytobacillus sp. FSL K6-0265]|uniref:YktB family protein n=1 Tax=Cytobacillus sp. FSL K6-0265 TaxID=2921448 RepID=UPI0030F80642
MTFNGFKKEDFDVFTIDGLEERMEALIATVRPKLEALGETFSPFLSAETGDEMSPHVAKHARRTKNPPNDTWVAFANNPRGYKMLPHFQIGLWETHVFIWFAVIYEAPNKVEIAEKLQTKINEIYDEIPQDFVWSLDHTKPEVIKHSDLTKEELKNMFIRLQNVKKAELLCGINMPKEEAIKLSGSEFITYTESVFKKVIPLYQL